MKSKLVSITLPEDLAVLAKRFAAKKRKTLSRLVGEQLRSVLTQKDVNSLSDWPTPGRPRKDA